MAFAYYRRLTPAQKRIYRASDAVTAVPLPDAGRFRDFIRRLEDELQAGRRPQTQQVCQVLLDGLAQALTIAPVKIKVLAARPHKSWGELHGLYYPSDEATVPSITVWMRTARQRRVVAFKSFLRTVLHEFGHHLDYALLKLDDSFHTEGFYKRESSLFHQLTGAGRAAQPAAPAQPAPADPQGYADFRDKWARLKQQLDGED